MFKFKRSIATLVLFLFMFTLSGAAYARSYTDGVTKQLNDAVALINQSGFSEQTLDKLTEIEKQVYAGSSAITLSDVSICYNAYLSNLSALQKNDALPEAMKRWDAAMQKVYAQKKTISEAFANELYTKSCEFVYDCISTGTACDSLMLAHTKKITGLFSKAVKANKSFPKSLYQMMLSNQAYAMLLNKKYQDLNDTITAMEKVKDQLTGTSMNEISLTRAYKYMLQGNYAKGEKIINNYKKLMGKTVIKEAGPYRTAINDILDDIYQFKKRKIGSNFVDKLQKSLPTPVLKIAKISPDGNAGKAGIQQGDLIVGYQDTKGLCYYQFVDLVAQNQEQANVKIQILRNGKAFTYTIPGGRLGVNLEESYVK